jgi:hypothetical protein
MLVERISFMRIVCLLSLGLGLASIALPQSVISVRAGIVNVADGGVFINGQPLSKKFGTFPSLHEGSDLYTQNGRAELQLGPSVFLRVGLNSAVRMVSSNLEDPQLRILNGSAIFDSGNAPSPGSVTLQAADASIFIEAPGRMRIDADPPQLRVEKGAARVTVNGVETVVQADQMLPLAGDSVVRRTAGTNDDALDEWSRERNSEIYLSLATSQSLRDPGTDADPAAPADLSDWLGYMPLSGVLPVTGIYATAQPSLGYTYPYGYNPYVPIYVRAYMPSIYGYGGMYGGGMYTGYSVGYPHPTFMPYRSIYSPAPGLGRSPIFVPRPVIGPRPAAPHPAIHR